MKANEDLNMNTFPIEVDPIQIEFKNFKEKIANLEFKLRNSQMLCKEKRLMNTKKSDKNLYEFNGLESDDWKENHASEPIYNTVCKTPIYPRVTDKKISKINKRNEYKIKNQENINKCKSKSVLKEKGKKSNMYKSQTNKNSVKNLLKESKVLNTKYKHLQSKYKKLSSEFIKLLINTKIKRKEKTSFKSSRLKTSMISKRKIKSP